MYSTNAFLALKGKRGHRTSNILFLICLKVITSEKQRLITVRLQIRSECPT